MRAAARPRRRTETATQLGQLPKTQDALENGTITDDHAEAIAHARANADPSARAALDEHEADLLAPAPGETAFEFRSDSPRFVKRHSEDDGRTEWDRMKAKNRLRMWKNRDGMTQIAGELDPEWGRHRPDRRPGRRQRRTVPPRPPGPPRRPGHPLRGADNEHRLAEALVETCRRAEGQDHPTIDP